MNIAIKLDKHDDERINKLRIFSFNAIKAVPSQHSYTLLTEQGNFDYILEFKNDICIINANKFVEILNDSLNDNNLENEDLKITYKINTDKITQIETEIKSTYKKFNDLDFYNWLNNHLSGNSQFWAYNSENINFKIPEETDCIITVCSGLLPLVLISQLNQTGNIVLVDINGSCLEFQKYLIKNIDRLNSLKTYQELIENFSSEYRVDPAGPMNSDQIESFIDRIKAKKHIIKQCSIHYLLVDLREPNDNIISYLQSASAPFVFFSNIFSYAPTIFGNNSEKDFVLFLNVLLGSNLNVKWYGDSPERICSSNLYAQSEDNYYWKINIELPYKEFLEEIAVLESKNLFVNHRTEDGHKGVYFNYGWASFCIHGLAYNKTHGAEQYGYTEETAPYNFTLEALEHCPKIVNWFKERAFKNRYHRVRLMKLEPGGIIGLHNDNNNSSAVATNMAINNPKSCEMHFLNRKYQYLGLVPWKDGDVYKIQIGLNHYVVNKSNENRYHIIVHGNGGYI